MKITPSNQTLILAGERRGAGAASGTSPGKSAAIAASAGSVLQRLTIVAARPDSTVVYLRADYSAASSPTTASRSSGSSLALRPVGTTRDAYGNSVSSSSTTAGISSYLRPVEQYAQTQRILGITPRVPQIDVHA